MLLRVLVALLCIEASLSSSNGGGYHESPPPGAYQNQQQPPQGQQQQPYQYSYPPPPQPQNQPPPPYGNNPQNMPPPPPGRFPAQGGFPPPGQQSMPNQQQPPSGYYRNPLYPPQQPQQQQEGFFSKIKNVVSSGINAIANSFDVDGEPGNYPPPPPHYDNPNAPRQLLPPPPLPQGQQPGQGQLGQGQGPPPGYGSNAGFNDPYRRGPPPPPPGYPSSSSSYPQQQQDQQQQQQSGGEGLLSRVARSLFRGENSGESDQMGGGGPPPPLPPSPFQQQQSQYGSGSGVGTMQPPPPSFGRPPPPPGYPQQIPPPPPGVASGSAAPGSYPRMQSSPPGAPGVPGPASGSSSGNFDPYAMPPSQPQQPPQQAQQQQPPSSASSYPSISLPIQPPPTSPVVPPAIGSADWLASLPSDPQVLIQDGDTIVLILKPQTFYRKKQEMIAQGQAGQGLQFFTDFEKVMTKFKTSDGKRAYDTLELLENSGAISQEALSKLQQIVEEYNNKGASTITSHNSGHSGGEDAGDGSNMVEDCSSSSGSGGSLLVDSPEMLEEFTKTCQEIITTLGNLHIASVMPATRNSLDKLPLRDGWKDALQLLALRAVPTYIFSSGYGDVVANLLLAQGLSMPSPVSADPMQQGQSSSAAVLPSNLRIISNFFRAGPDGTVRAFSAPIVHERNKNAYTAAKHMGMPLPPNRPYAIVVGSHEEDLTMTEGLTSTGGGVKEQLSIGYLELTDDLATRLPVYLNTFDAVILGDGSYKFLTSLLEDILGLSVAQHLKRDNAASSSGIAGGMSNLAGRLPGLPFGLKKMFQGGDNNQPQQPQQQPPQQPQQPMYGAVPGQGQPSYQQQPQQAPPGNSGRPFNEYHEW